MCSSSVVRRLLTAAATSFTAIDLVVEEGEGSAVVDEIDKLSRLFRPCHLNIHLCPLTCAADLNAAHRVSRHPAALQRAPSVNPVLHRKFHRPCLDSAACNVAAQEPFPRQGPRKAPPNRRLRHSSLLLREAARVWERQSGLNLRRRVRM
jgi:hypothetical protein